MNCRKQQREHRNVKSSKRSRFDQTVEEEMEFNQTFPSNTQNCIPVSEGSSEISLLPPSVVGYVCKKAAVAKKEKELPLFIFNQAKRRRKWKELMCVWVLMAVTSLCWAHKWTIAGVSIETCLERYECVRTHPFVSRPANPLLSVNFQIFILHYILSPYMKRAFKPRANRSKLF